MLQSRQKRSNSGQRDNQMDVFGFGGFQNRLMKNFGMGFGGDFFSMDMFSDPFSEIQSFSKMHKKAHDRKTDGAYYCETYVQSSKMGDDGKMMTEKYYDRNYGQHKSGNTISEKQQAYQNSKGQKRLAEEQMLNNKGRKVIKDQHPNGQIEEKYNYYNMDPDDNFELEWNNMNQQIGFRDNVQKLGYGNGRNMEEMMAIEDFPRENQNRSSKNSNMNNSSKMKELGYDNKRDYGRSTQKFGNSNYPKEESNREDTRNTFGDTKQSYKGGETGASKFRKSNSVYDENPSKTRESKFKEFDNFGKGSYRK